MSQSLCPIHEHARRECDERCEYARRELRRLCHAYSQLWLDRHRGVRAMPLSEYRARGYSQLSSPRWLPTEQAQTCAACGEPEPCVCERQRSFVRIETTAKRMSTLTKTPRPRLQTGEAISGG